MDTRVAVISVIVQGGAPTEELNRLLHSAAPYIIGRMGIPYRKRGISLISVAIDAPQDVISALSGRLGSLPGITAKTAYTAVVSDEDGALSARKLADGCE